MAISHAAPGEVVDVRPLGPALATAETRTLVKTDDFELIRLIVPGRKQIPAHQAKGDVVVQCLEGKIGLTVGNKTHELAAGQLLYVPTGEPHSVHGIEDGSLLVYILLPRK